MEERYLESEYHWACEKRKVPAKGYYGHSLVVHIFSWHDTSVIFVSCQLEFGTKERRPSHEMLFKGRTYPFANQQLACLNIILAGQFWSSQPLSLYLKNKHANHQVHLCSFEFCCSFNSCSTYFGECMRTSNASFHLWWWLGVWWLWLLWGSRWRHWLMATSPLDTSRSRDIASSRRWVTQLTSIVNLLWRHSTHIAAGADTQFYDRNVRPNTELGRIETGLMTEPLIVPGLRRTG